MKHMTITSQVTKTCHLFYWHNVRKVQQCFRTIKDCSIVNFVFCCILHNYCSDLMCVVNWKVWGVLLLSFLTLHTSNSEHNMLPAIFLILTLSVAPWSKVKSELENAFTKIAVNTSATWNDSSVIISYVSAQGAFGVAAGYRDNKNKIKALPNDATLVGDVTSTVTMANVLRLVEKDIFELDDCVSKLVNPYLLKYANFTLESLFGQNISLVTVTDLLSMRSGLKNLQIGKLINTHKKYPHYVPTPFSILKNFAPKEFVCIPGSCGFYSITNYVIAGLLLVTYAGPAYNEMIPWYVYQAADVFPKRPNVLYDSCKFPTSETLEMFQTPSYNVSNGYLKSGAPVWDWSAGGWWTGGNMLTNGQDLAHFVFDLYGPTRRILSPAMMSVSFVLDFQPLINRSLDYGMATFFLYSGPEKLALTNIGSAFGFDSAFTFSANYNFSLVVTMNHNNIMDKCFVPLWIEAYNAAYSILSSQ